MASCSNDGTENLAVLSNHPSICDGAVSEAASQKMCSEMSDEFIVVSVFHHLGTAWSRSRGIDDDQRKNAFSNSDDNLESHPLLSLTESWRFFLPRKMKGATNPWGSNNEH